MSRTPALRPGVFAVTGGGSGIGKVTARLFAESGCAVAILDANEKAAEEVAHQLESSGAKAIAVGVDVSDEAQVAARIGRIVSHFGRLDYVFNGAGVRQTGFEITEMPADVWEQVIRVNLSGVFFSLKAELKQMYAQGSGCIVNAASLLGLVGRARTAGYAASKHGVCGLTKVAALEAIGRNVRVNAVAPGFTVTPMTADMFPGGHSELERVVGPSVPAGRLASPEEIASVIAWLCSSGASYVVGQTISCDGGYTTQ